MLDNGDPLLASVWHVATTSAEVGSTPTTIRLLGTTWHLQREGDAIVAVAEDGTVPAGLAERYGFVWIAPRASVVPLPVLEEMADPEFTTGVISRTTRVAAGVLIDNFLDVSHFSYLHRETFGRVAPVTTAGCRVERDGWQVRMTHSTDLHEGASAQDKQRNGQQTTNWRIATYTVLAPYVVHLQMHFPATGSTSAATFLCRPDSDDATTVYVLVAWPVSDPAGLQEQLDFSTEVLQEDLNVLELMADPRLELSLHAELHTKADRASVEYRRLMSDYLAEGDDTILDGAEVAVGAAHR